MNIDLIIFIVWSIFLFAGVILVWGPKYRKLAIFLLIIGLAPYINLGYVLYSIIDACEFEVWEYCFQDILWDTP